MTKVEDYYRSTVPASERRGLLSVLFPLLGYEFIYAIVYAGGIFR